MPKVKISFILFQVAIPFYEGHVSTNCYLTEKGLFVNFDRLSQSLFMKGMFQQELKLLKEVLPPGSDCFWSQSLFMKGMFQQGIVLKTRRNYWKNVEVAIPFYEGHVSTIFRPNWSWIWKDILESQSLFKKGMFQPGSFEVGGYVSQGQWMNKSQSLFM